MKWLKRAVWELTWVLVVAVIVSSLAAYVGTALYAGTRWALVRLGIV